MSQDPTGAEIGTDPAVDVSGDTTDNENYHGYSVDDENQPQDTGDSLVDDDRGLADPLDEGYSPPEKWSAGQRYGNTPLEESLGETLDQRVEQEVPEPDPYEEAERAAEAGELKTLVTEAPNAEDPAAVGTEEREVGDDRSGRLVAPDEGARDDVEKDLVATDVGIDGAAAGAEEAAVHTIDEDDLLT
ncbi:DUF5709 domain-containing protein [Nocardioides zeae]|uniref:DUF5709 domain-containing protein n=1 Tax=Nocardioides imazamoxiresistens TaxID=3231893 RepID=A0ABU3PTS9_9ACTN|nr:DUF5709 domain-containing protein [Nocardioides zeae]MDT9592637.1 DUF5709 domain-containing protein [Nocardioides zeae]